MGFDKVVKQTADGKNTYTPEFSLNGNQPVWPDLVPLKEPWKDPCHSGSCPTIKFDQHSSKTLEDKGLLHRFTLLDNGKHDDKSKSEDLYRFSGPERGNMKVEHVMTLEDYEVRIKDLEARLAAQTEKLAKLIKAEESHEHSDSSDYANRPTNLARPADGSHFVFDRNGNGQLIGPHGEHQYNLINGERVWIKDANSTCSDTQSTSSDNQSTSTDTQSTNSSRRSTTSDSTPIRSGCANGTCGSCPSCRPRTHLFRY